MNPYISIIIPAYKVEDYIGDCLTSIVSDAAATEETVEVLVIDDGSPDNSGAIAESFTVEYPFVRVIHKANGGVAAARNTGIEAAKGQWLYFVDSDDWLVQDAFGVILQRCKEYADADMILFDAWQNQRGEERAWEHFSREQVWTKEQDIRRMQRGVLYYPCAFKDTKVPLAAPWDKVFKASFIRENGLHFRSELKVLDDMIFSMEVLGRAKKVAYCKDRIYHYRYVPSSITNSYKPSRVNKDKQVFQFIEEYVERESREHAWTEDDKANFLQAFYCRVIKSFGICCRLSFFNKRNKKNIFSKMSFVKAVTESEPYRTAFEKVHIKNAEWRLKLLIPVGRTHSGFVVYLLHLGQSLIEK